MHLCNRVVTFSTLTIIAAHRSDTPAQTIEWVATHDNFITWKHFSASLAFCAGNSPITGEFPSHVSGAELWCFPYLCSNKRLSTQSRRRWFETPSHSLLRHSNANQPQLTQALRKRSRVYSFRRSTTIELYNAKQLHHTESCRVHWYIFGDESHAELEAKTYWI